MIQLGNTEVGVRPRIALEANDFALVRALVPRAPRLTEQVARHHPVAGHVVARRARNQAGTTWPGWPGGPRLLSESDTAAKMAELLDLHAVPAAG